MQTLHFVLITYFEQLENQIYCFALNARQFKILAQKIYSLNNTFATLRCTSPCGHTNSFITIKGFSYRLSLWRKDAETHLAPRD